MTNKPMLSVERELVERIVGIYTGGLHRDGVNALHELRALLDEPDEPFNLQGWSIDHSAGRPILMHNKCSVIEAEQAYGLLNLIETADHHQNSNPGWPDPLESTLAKEIINNPSAFDLEIRDLFDKLCREIQAGRYYRRFSGSESMEFTANQGEPVAWQFYQDGKWWNGDDRIKDHRKNTENSGYKTRELYAEQPEPVADHTQCEECKGWGYHENHHEGGGTECGECGGSGNATVAVVMPERDPMDDPDDENVYEESYAKGWNEALAEVARLNGVKP